MTDPAPDPDRVADPDPGATPEKPKTPVWWTAVPVLVGAYAVYGLAQGDTGSIWPWGDIVILVVALVLLGVVLAPRLRGRR
ncbi:hypothetical protein [Klenkia terrae]|jgi:hypothetical protein|uniref:DUF2631 domain-containing protein n=1 Tax=Klenkia terrae TaxID=1052259 RepID=A0ABU8E7W7_9ACTN|nr:hypothetical protein [Klenkia terrae]SSC22982.1 Hypothetical protein KLENKIAIHU_1576 [Klenkia terrae]